MPRSPCVVPGHPHPRAFQPKVGLFAPGAICFTTAGPLWYLPGAILVGSGVAALTDLRSETSTLRATIDRNWTSILTAVLALFYVFLGATALGLAGVLGILGGLAVLAVLAFRTRLAPALGLALLAVATVPFALLVWWSFAVPLIGILLIATGWTALRSSAQHTGKRSTGVVARSD
ncbi:MAG: hypothetical protein JWO17_401 [Actinomycetia bacterium]|nr:hypothetical protein [Actinomycetes bacterium]